MDRSDSESEEGSARALQLIGSARDVRFKFLCLVTGGPRPSDELASFNLKLFDCCALAPADTIINRFNERPVPCSLQKRPSDPVLTGSELSQGSVTASSEQKNLVLLVF